MDPVTAWWWRSLAKSLSCNSIMVWQLQYVYCKYEHSDRLVAQVTCKPAVLVVQVTCKATVLVAQVTVLQSHCLATPLWYGSYNMYIVNMDAVTGWWRRSLAKSLSCNSTMVWQLECVYCFLSLSCLES